MLFFFVYMNWDLKILSFRYILIFDIVCMNVGNYYNRFFGIFIVFYFGIYVFMWIVYCFVGGYIFF